MPKSNSSFTDTIVLSGDRSIMFSHLEKPDLLKNIPSPVDQADSNSIAKFGLFGGSNNYHTFYPNMEPKDFTPSDEDFIQPVFRMLSACIVSKNWFPTEFSEEVLKASMNLLVGQTVNCDHSTDIANAIGSVLSVEWQESYKSNGITVPAGINAVLKIDAKSNPRIARGIMMDPPSIHSNSVTVQIEWEPSHPLGSEDLPDLYAFISRLGSYDNEGNMYRRVVTKIISYKETSLVSHGADPFAQKLSNGKIVNPIYADRVYSSYKEYVPEDQARLRSMGFIDYRDPYTYEWTLAPDIMVNQEKVYTFGSNNITPVEEEPNHNTGFNNNKNKDTNMKDLQEFLQSLFGENMLSLAEGQEITRELVLREVQSLVASNSSLQRELSERSTTISSLNEQIVKLENDLKSTAQFVEMGKNHLNTVRLAALESYRKLAGDKADDNIIALIEANTTNLETLISLKKSYDVQLEEKFPLSCSDCGSRNVTRGSAVVENGEKVETSSNKSTEESIRNIKEKKYAEYRESIAKS